MATQGAARVEFGPLDGAESTGRGATDVEVELGAGRPRVGDAGELVIDVEVTVDDPAGDGRTVTAELPLSRAVEFRHAFDDLIEAATGREIT